MIWHELARTHTGEALIDAVGTALFDQCNGNGICPCPPLGDPHWRRRALAMLRQAHLLPVSAEPSAVARGRQTEALGAGPTSGDAAMREISVSHGQSTTQIGNQDHVA